MKSRLLKIFSLMLMAVAVIPAAGCIGDGPDEPVVTVLSLNTYELTMKQYEEEELTAYLPEELKGQEVTWSTADIRKVKVTPSSSASRKAVLTSLAVTNSAVTITASCGGQTAKCKVNVAESDTERLILITVDGELVTNETMDVGDTMQLSSVLRENNKTVAGAAFTYVSHTESSVSVSQTGFVTALRRGVGIVVSAETVYKGQTVTARVIITVRDETKDSASFEFMTDASRSSTLSVYTGSVTALGFDSGTAVTAYNGKTADYSGNGSAATHAVFDKKVIVSEGGSLISDYDKVVFDVSFGTTLLPYMNFWMGGSAVSVKLPQLTQSDGGTAVAFFNPANQTQATMAEANKVYTCVISLTQMDTEGSASGFGFAFVPDSSNSTAEGTMYIGKAFVCTDYIYVNDYGFPTPAGKITKGAYLCYSEVGGYANIPSSSDISLETSGTFTGWHKIDYQRACPVGQVASFTHEHTGSNAVNPVCNRIQPMLPEIGKWAASLGANGYWNYDYWGFDLAIGTMPTGAWTADSKTIPEGGEGIVIYLRSGGSDFGITRSGYVVAMNEKEGGFSPEYLEVFDSQGSSLISLDNSTGLYKMSLEAGKVYTFRIRLYRGHDSYGLGMYSSGAGYWYANNPFFEKN